MRRSGRDTVIILSGTPRSTFDDSKFGNAGVIGLVGRNVDLLGRTITNRGDPVESVRKWLREGKIFGMVSRQEGTDRP
jgi:hypothetical protein